MARSNSRPLSPHLTIWKWGPHAVTSIIHRVTGNGLATAGALGLIWWLMAAATGPEAYATFVACATSPIGYLVMIGLTWFFFQHLFSGLRHFVMDIGAGYELRSNRISALATFAASLLVTGLVWLYIFGKAF